MAQSLYKLLLALLLVVVFCSINEVEAQAMGSILSPWGGDLGGSWSSPIGSYSSASNWYNNGVGFL
ncbi:hypothetical protein M3Y99_00131400 [Aphelenchoides fujianensis]|nr:hypothetical protein M3Y99_00131400 [Aphelenchoides fujianensis]